MQQPGPPRASGVAGRVRRAHGLRALSHGDFRRAWTAFQVTQLGFWVSNVGLQWAMARAAPGDASWLGLLFFANFVPILLLSPFAGVLADRRSRQAVLAGAFTWSVAVVVLLAALSVRGALSPPALAGLAFCLGVGLAFSAPTGQAMVAGLVSAEDLASAVSLHSVGLNASRVVGPALAVPVLARWGAAGAFLAYAAALVAGIALLSRIKLPPLVPPPGDAGFIARLREGLAHVRERPPAGLALATMAVLSVFVLPYVALYPVVALERLGGDERVFALLLMATGVGAVLGALRTAASRAEPGLRAVAGYCLGLAAALGGFALSRTVFLSMACVGVAGFCSYAASTTLNTLLQQLTDEERRGRVMGLFILCWGGLIPFGGLWMGAAAEQVGPHGIIGAGAAIAALYAMWLWRRAGVSPPA